MPVPTMTKSHKTLGVYHRIMLLAVSLDSVSLPWLEERISAGRLPNLATLMKRGIEVPLNAARLAGVAYPSIYTGLSPSKHGIYFPFQWKASDQRLVSWHELPSP